MDFLDEDTVTIPSQNYALISIVSPNSTQKSNVTALKIKGVFEHREDAQKYVQKLMQIDDTYDIFLVDMYKWLAIPPDMCSIDAQVHQEKQLNDIIQDVLNQELLNQNRTIPTNGLAIEITAQGGVGTEEEHTFLLDHYNLDSVGWGSPFLLVPEATTVDENTLKKLATAKENDLYLSDVSPLGVPFNNLRDNTKDNEKQTKIDKGRPGSSCPKKFVALNKEFKETGICTASREYQFLKIKQLESQELPHEEFQKEFNKIVVKSCTCVGLGTSTLLAYGLDTKVEGKGVSICPGPNMAYYSKVMSLENITDHIYGRANMVSSVDRPNLFVKELHIYMDYLKNKLEESKMTMTKKEEKYLLTFTNNMKTGVSYYQNLFDNVKDAFNTMKSSVLCELEKSEVALNQILLDIQKYKINIQV